MIDHIVGRPSPSWKRVQVFLVLIFWISRIVYGSKSPPRSLWLRPINRTLARFSPWQIVISTLTTVYAIRNLDNILGLGAPEPLARLYSPSYYRATWIATGFDAGFATAMSIRPKWLKNICSILFSVYYIIYANEADEKLRKFRAIPTVEMLRTTWEKTTNPYLRLTTWLPRVCVRRKLLLARPTSSIYKRPVTAYLFFEPPERYLHEATDIILDFPGGGFVAMTPEHHEDRLRMWAQRTGKPVLAIEYGKAPEYPYPYAIDEAFDIYQALVESSGKIIGMSGRKLNIIMSGDSAGASIAVCVMLKLLESQGHDLQHPTALVLNYAALDFNFTSWMSPENLRLLHSESSSGFIPDLAQQRDHYSHISPLSMVGDRPPLRRHRSWKDALLKLTSHTAGAEESSSTVRLRSSPSMQKARSLPTHSGRHSRNRTRVISDDEADATAGGGDVDETNYAAIKEEDRPIQARVKFHDRSSRSLKSLRVQSSEVIADPNVACTTLGTRLTMTSRTGYFQDRIISPSMMRAMAIMYIGPLRNPDFATDYHVSPILAPRELLAQFPPLLMQCGEKDPFVDDTIIFAGRIREAKRSRKTELELELSGKSARFGEGLRMTQENVSDERVAAWRKELDLLDKEGDEDWVEMVIFSDWSHGYLQMATLMSEARAVIFDLADWMDNMFGTTFSGTNLNPSGSLVVPSLFSNSQPGALSENETDPDDHITFAPRRRSPPRAFKTFGIMGSPLSSGETLQDCSRAPEAEEPGPDSRQPTLLNGGITGTVGLAGKNKSRVARQTITESELMRRRRLLDSHVFSGGELTR